MEKRVDAFFKNNICFTECDSLQSKIIIKPE